MRPGACQNILEWIKHLQHGIVCGAIPGSQRTTFNLFALLLFLFIFISNQIGLFLALAIGMHTWFRSPTASPVILKPLAKPVLVISHYFGIVFCGFCGYLCGYVSPIGILLPINLLVQLQHFILLSYWLYGNIFAGVLLVYFIRQLAFSGGAFSFVSGFLLAIVWLRFSVFIGSILPTVFVTLGMV